MADDLDVLYDGWRAARKRGLTLAQHAVELGMDPAELRERLEGLLALESAMPASSLVGEALVEGATFAGYKLLRWLGEGGTGVVHEARDKAGKHVALKVVNPLLCAVAERRELLLREARIAQRLCHPNIVGVIECGVERGWAWIATDLVVGRRIDELGTISEDRALHLLLQLGRALEHAHTHGVVHRDLKPGNVLVTDDDQLKVLDFGLARSVAEPMTLSATGALVGTPLYMAPEQVCADLETGPHTDVHAAGLLLRDLLLGARAQAPSAVAGHLARLMRGRRAVTIGQLQRLPARSRRIVERCTRPHPRERMPSAKALVLELEHALKGQSPARDIPGLARATARTVLRSQLLQLGLPALAIAGGAAWRFGPVPVEFNTIRSGKQIWVDGEECGTAPVRMWLTPGRHEWKARFGSGGPWFSGTLDVNHGKSNRFLQVLQPVHGVPWVQGLGIGDHEPGAWVQVSTSLDRLKLALDGGPTATTPGICSFRVGPGRHRIVAEADGHRTRSVEFEVQEDRLHSFAWELDRTDDPWTTTLLYSAIDEPVRQALRRVEGAVQVWESAPIGQTGVHADRVYWAPEAARTEATVELEVNLPEGWSELDLELLHGPQYTGDEAWSTVSMGPTFDTLVQVARYSRDGTRDWSSESFDRFNTHIVRPPLDRMEALRAAMRGSQRLCIRLRAGGAPAPSSNVAWAQMLRCELLPVRSEGRELQWAPAIRIRTR